MQYQGGKLCISVGELTRHMSRSNYKYLVSKGKIEVVVSGRGSGNETWVSVASLPRKYREQVELDNGTEKKEQIMTAIYDRYYAYDDRAAGYYADYISPAGHSLEPSKIRELADNASACQSLLRYIAGMNMSRSASNEEAITWREIMRVSSYYRERYGHTLPDTRARLREKVSAFKRDGYASLLSGKLGNSNTRKIDDRVGQLLLQLAARSNNPFVEQIYEDYNAFVRGDIEVIDPQSGEIFDAREYVDRQGGPLELSKRTIDNFLTRPGNAVLIQAARESWITFYHNRMPHMHRKRPEYSLSKVTFDDRDLPRKERSTKQRPKAYYAYDVCSGVCLGAAYSRKKDIDLVVEMFRDFFRNLRSLGVGMPMQVEVENHLMSQWRDGFLKAGEVFPFVRFCAPQNSQEKSAEHYNRGKKIQVEHRYQDGIGRFYAKLEAYVSERKKQSDELNNTYEEKAYYSWDELIADDKQVIAVWNNLPHSNQKKYPGMTKMQVFMSQLNPNLTDLKPEVLARYIGEHRSTSIRRNDYCRINYMDWAISSPAVLEKLSSKQVEAYWLPEADGSMPAEVYIYQGSRYIDTLKPIVPYQEALCERTGDDWRNMQEQLQRRQAFVSYVQERSVSAAIVQQSDELTRMEKVRETAEEIEEVETPVDIEEAEATYEASIMSEDAVARMALGDL